MKRRVLAILTALVMFMSAVGVPTITKAQTTGPVWEWTRLKGSGRYGTMAAITDEAYWPSQDGKATHLILATGEAFPDALSGAALAGVYGCPIITTKPDVLRAEAKKEIERLASKDGCTVYVLGGSGAVSDDVLNAINEIEGVTAERIKGSNREATAIEVYKNGKAADNGFAGNDTFILATSKGYADTLSISPYAYASKTPILLTKLDGTLRDSVKDVILDAANGFKKAIIVGGTGVVTQETEDILTAGGIEVLRLKGKNRYATSAEIVKWELGLNTETTIQPAVTMKSEGMGVAVGENFPDALASANLLGKTKSVLLLVKNVEATDKPNIDEMVAPYTANMTKGYIFGGTGAVTEATEALLNAVVPTTTIYETPDEILTALYGLERNKKLSDGHLYELEGKIKSVDTQYEASYNNVSVTIEVEGFEDKPVQAFRLTAKDAEMNEKLPVLKANDKIKVRGVLKDYNGKKEFDAGCLLLEYTEGASEPIYETPEEIVNALYELPDNGVLSGGHVYELEGKITSVNQAYTEQYGTTVTIVVGDMTDKPIECFRMKTEDPELTEVIKDLHSGDTIKVKGILKKYGSKPEFDSGCLLVAYTAGSTGPTIYETPEQILKALYELGDNQLLSDGYEYELEGKITAIIEAYSSYDNATVKIVVGEWTEYPVVAYRMKADAGELHDALMNLKVGDTITVKGKLQNYVKDGVSTKEFTSGCKLIAYTAGGETPKTDQEKVDEQAAALVLSEGPYTEATVVTLPLPELYPETTVVWSVAESPYVVKSEDGTKLVITLPEDEDKTVAVTAALTLGTGTTTRTWNLTVKKAGTEPPEEGWVKVAWDDITEEDVIAITMYDETTTWILPNAAATNAGPAAVVVERSENTINPADPDAVSWTRKAATGGFTFYSTAEAGRCLYVTNNNNGVRVNSNEANNVFTLATENGKDYLLGSDGTNPRYIGVYVEKSVGKDWRCYKAVNDNIKAETVEFWKLTSSGEEPPVGPDDDEKLETEYLNLNLGPISVGPGVVSEDMTYPLPLEGGTYPEVKITWISDKDNVAVVDGNLVITQIDEEVLANVTATLSLNGKTRTKNFPITVTAKEGGEEPEEFTETFVFSELYGETTTLDTVTLGDIVLAFTQETSNDAPKYNTSGKAVRFYAKNRLVVRFAEGKAGTLTKIVINFSGESYAKKITADHGGYVLEGAIGTWTGSVAEEGFVNSDTAQARIASIVVTYVLNN